MVARLHDRRTAHPGMIRGGAGEVGVRRFTTVTKLLLIPTHVVH